MSFLGPHSRLVLQCIFVTKIQCLGQALLSLLRRQRYDIDEHPIE